MNSSLTKLINAFCFCGISKDEYRKVKKDAYVANYQSWKELHVILAVIFGGLIVACLMIGRSQPQWILPFIGIFLYMLVMSIVFFLLIKPKSLIGQLLIYLSMIVLLLFSAYHSAVLRPTMIATVFPILLVIFSLFMIDKPYFMAILLGVSSVIFLIISFRVKTGEALSGDIVITVLFCILGIIFNIMYNRLRVKEFTLQRELERARDTDGLTGLTNRAALTRAVNESLKKSSRTGVMMMMDIDHFKDINDTYGHAAGDTVLEGLAAILISKFGNEGYVGRFGGDEFCVFLPEMASSDEAKKAAESLIEEVNGTLRTPARTEQIGICVGIAKIDVRDADFDDLSRRADIALYNAKRNGRNRSVVYGTQIGQET